MVYRIFIDVLLFLVLILLPWWVGLILALFFLFYFTSFYEVLFAGLLLDLLYSTSVGHFYGFHFVITLVCIVAFVVSYPLKRRLTFYGNDGV